MYMYLWTRLGEKCSETDWCPVGEKSVLDRTRNDAMLCSEYLSSCKVAVEILDNIKTELVSCLLKIG